MRYRRSNLLGAVVWLVLAPGPPASSQLVEEIFDANDHPEIAFIDGMEVGADGTVFVVGRNTDNALEISPDGTVTEIIDASGDGTFALDQPVAVAVDSSGNVFVSGWNSHNVFKISSGGTISRIIWLTGDGAGNTLVGPWGIDVDAAGNVYVAGRSSDNVFRVEPGGTITELIDSTGDGLGNVLDSPRDVTVRADGTVYVSGTGSDNLFRIAPNGDITEILDAAGDGTFGYQGTPTTLDSNGNLYTRGNAGNDTVFKIVPDGNITALVDFQLIGKVAASPSGRVYFAGRPVSGCSPNPFHCEFNLWERLPGGEINKVVGQSIITQTIELSVTSQNVVYQLKQLKVFRITGPTVPSIGPLGLTILAALATTSALWVLRSRQTRVS